VNTSRSDFDPEGVYFGQKNFFTKGRPINIRDDVRVVQTSTSIVPVPFIATGIGDLSLEAENANFTTHRGEKRISPFLVPMLMNAAARSGLDAFGWHWLVDGRDFDFGRLAIRHGERLYGDVDG